MDLTLYIHYWLVVLGLSAAPLRGVLVLLCVAAVAGYALNLLHALRHPAVRLRLPHGLPAVGIALVAWFARVNTRRIRAAQVHAPGVPAARGSRARPSALIDSPQTLGLRVRRQRKWDCEGGVSEQD